MPDSTAVAMAWLAQKPETIFVGQAVGAGGIAMSESFVGVPAEKRIEFPVAEEFQVGWAIGMALEGFLPICVFPRMDFMLRAADQIVHHLDRIPLYSDFNPKVIVRCLRGSTKPLNPGPQHDGDFTKAFRAMLRHVDVKMVDMKHPTKSYVQAYASPRSVIMVE